MTLSFFLAKRLLRKRTTARKGVRGLYNTTGDSISYLGKRIGQGALVSSVGVGTGALILGQTLGVAGRGIRELTGNVDPQDLAQRNIDLMDQETEARKRSFDEYMRQKSIWESKQKDPFFKDERNFGAPWNPLVEGAPGRDTQEPQGWGLAGVGILVGLAMVAFGVVKR